MAQWYRVGFYKDRLKDILGSNIVKFFKNLIFFYIYLVLSSLFPVKCFTYYQIKRKQPQLESGNNRGFPFKTTAAPRYGGKLR